MRPAQASTLALLLATITTALPTAEPEPGTTLWRRDLTWTNQPSADVQCLNIGDDVKKTATYTADLIAIAISAAVDAINNNKLLYSGGSGTTKGTPYPHINTPGQSQNSKDSWSDYNLDTCAQEGDTKGKKAGFVEFPILRDGGAYDGGAPGPDRVLFQFVTDGDMKVSYDTPGFKNLNGKYGESLVFHSSPALLVFGQSSREVD